jgi:HPt (histidine-containing phosphotransfer) domain-containing protein
MNKVKIVIDKDLKDLIPGYLANRYKDIKQCAGLVSEEKYGEIANVGHRLKGNARTYGFLYLEELGSKLEDLATSKNESEIRTLLIDYELYLNNLEISYEEI